jgi:acyl carrier protein
VFFLAPFIVRAGNRRDLSVTLTPEADGYAFAVRSKYVSGAACEHVRGRIRFMDVKPLAHSIPEIEARCNLEDRQEARLEQAEHIHFGQHWQNIRRVQLGHHEALLTISLDEELQSEVAHFGIHPSMMDMATGGAHSLIPSHDWHTHYFLPFSYGSLRYFRPFTSTIHSHIRYRTDLQNDEGIAVFDVTIMDPDGNVLVAVTDYVVRRVPVAGPGGEEPAYVAASDPLYGSETIMSDVADGGISPSEGVEAFRRLVAGRHYPQLIVSPRSISARVAEAGAQSEPDAASDADPGATVVSVQHARPDLATPYVAPDAGIEETLAVIWRRALGLESVGAQDNFFELGGHSLMVVTIHGEIQKALDVSYPVAKAFQFPTIRALAEYVAELRQKSTEPVDRVNDELSERAQRQKDALARRRAMSSRVKLEK